MQKFCKPSIDGESRSVVMVDKNVEEEWGIAKRHKKDLEVEVCVYYWG